MSDESTANGLVFTGEAFEDHCSDGRFAIEKAERALASAAQRSKK
jgi:hypothetical protein